MVTRVVLGTGHQRGSCCPRAAVAAPIAGVEAVAASVRERHGTGIEAELLPLLKAQLWVL